MRPKYYNKAGEEISGEEWSHLRADDFEKNCVVGRDAVGDVEISTVLLGLDHGWMDDGPPVIFETMVWAPDEEYTERYSTLQEATEGHARIVEQAIKMQKRSNKPKLSIEIGLGKRKRKKVWGG